MSTEQNKANSRRVFDEVLNKGNLAVVDELFNADNVVHTPTGPVYGVEGYKQFVNMYLSAYPDLQFTIEDLLAEGDKVVARWTGTGTHQGSLMGIPPTGKRVTVTGMNINRFENGKFLEVWLEFDGLGMLQQLGVIPAMG
jgi:steroid delta-isomerase-like uncharacterized protein